MNRCLLVLLFCLCWLPSAHALDRISVEFELQRMDVGGEPLPANPPSQQINFIQLVPNTYTLPPKYGQAQSSQDLVLIALNGEGIELERSLINDDSRVKGEAFNEDGTITGSTVYLQKATFYASLPAKTRNIALYRPNFIDSVMSLALIDKAVIENPSAMTTFSRSSTLNLRSTMSEASMMPEYNVTKVLDNGDSQKRYDIVFVGDGYAAIDMEEYASAVESFKNMFITYSPFADYSRVVNIHRIDVISSDSGIDNPNVEPEKVKDTVFDASIEKSDSSSNRLLRSNKGKVLDVVSRHMASSEKDAIVLLVKSDEYGRANYNDFSTVIGNKPSTNLTILHELGHGFGLSDEYLESSTVCANSGQKETDYAYNVTYKSEREQVRWSYWLDPLTPAPTFEEDLDALVALGVTDEENKSIVPAVYPRGLKDKGCDYEMYIPAQNSMMRNTFSSNGFGKVNEEVIVRKLMESVSLISNAYPVLDDRPVVLVKATSNEDFQVTTESFSVEDAKWFLDDRNISSGNSYQLSAGQLAQGSYFNLEAIAKHQTEKVRLDPNGSLNSKQLWTLYTDNCQIAPSVPDNIASHAFGDFGLKITWDNADEAAYYQVQLTDNAGFSVIEETIDNTIILSGLNEASDYQVSVEAINLCGRAQSTPSTVSTTRCDADFGEITKPVVELVGDTFAKLSWEGAHGADAYDLSYSLLDGSGITFHLQKNLIATETTVTGLPENANLQISITGRNSCAVSKVETVDVSTKKVCKAAPSAPNNTRISYSSNTSFTVTWDTVPDALSYSLYRFENGIYIGKQETSDNHFTYNGLNDASEQEVFVRANNSCGISSEKSVTYAVYGCSVAPEAPSGIRFTDVGYTNYSINWNTQSDAEGYVLKTFFNNALKTIGPIQDNYYDFNGLDAGSTQYVGIAAVNSCGTSNSTYVNVTLDDSCTVPPAAPIDLVFSELEAQRYTVSWSPVAGAESYTLNTVVDGEFIEVDNIQGHSYSASGLEPESYQVVNLKAVNQCGASQSSVVTSQLRKYCAASTLASPSTISVLDKGASYITVAWDSVPDANSYEVNRYSGAVPPPIFINETTQTFTGLEPGSMQLITVASQAACGKSEDYASSGFLTLYTCEELHQLGKSDSACSIQNSQGSVLIKGVTKQGETLTADIADENGIANASIAYQWLHSNHGLVATTSAYTLQARDAGGTISLNVVYTDDAGFSENLTSSATPIVKALPQGGSYQANNISAGWFGWNRYSVSVPEGMTKLKVRLSDGTGNASLYLRPGQAPSASSYDCRSANSGNNESCIINNPISGAWYIGVYSGWSSVSGAKLNIEWLP